MFLGYTNTGWNKKKEANIYKNSIKTLKTVLERYGGALIVVDYTPNVINTRPVRERLLGN